MTTGSAGAVFFLGTRAHYQVLQQPETHSFDRENGNASTETIYPNPSQELQKNETNKLDYKKNWNNCDLNKVIVNDKDGNIEIGTGVKRRSKQRCASEITLCERDDLKPAQLNNLNSDLPKPRAWRARTSLAALLARLARRKNDPPSFRLHSTLTECSYREACRCFDCQSRYFECDESDDYSSDDSEYSRYLQEYQNDLAANEANYVNGNEDEDLYDDDENGDDEVFIDTVPGDNTSTDLLIDKPSPKPESKPRYIDKMSISSDDVDDASLQLEVAAGTPALLNYLLTHPVTCAIQ